jgi:hypothetical protein
MKGGGHTYRESLYRGHLDTGQYERIEFIHGIGYIAFGHGPQVPVWGLH